MVHAGAAPELARFAVPGDRYTAEATITRVVESTASLGFHGGLDIEPRSPFASVRSIHGLSIRLRRRLSRSPTTRSDGFLSPVAPMSGTTMPDCAAASRGYSSPV